MSSFEVGNDKTGKDLGLGERQTEVKPWFREQLLAALSDPLFNVSKAFETWMIDRVAMAGLNISVGQVIGAKAESVSLAEFDGIGAARDGQQLFLDVDSSTTWFLRYNGSAASNPWQYVAGPPLSSEVVASVSTSSTTYVDLTGGPTVTIPRNGDYRISFGVRFHDVNHWAAPKFGSNSTSDDDGVNLISTSPISGISGTREIVKTGLSANDVVKLQYRSNDGGSHAVSHRFLHVTPISIS